MTRAHFGVDNWKLFMKTDCIASRYTYFTHLSMVPQCREVKSREKKDDEVSYRSWSQDYTSCVFGGHHSNVEYRPNDNKRRNRALNTCLLVSYEKVMIWVYGASLKHGCGNLSSSIQLPQSWKQALRQQIFRQRLWLHVINRGVSREHVMYMIAMFVLTLLPTPFLREKQL